MDRRDCLRRAASAAAGLACARLGGAAPALAGRKPNIVFILTDDQGYGDLGCHGNPVLKTPNLDRLHREGVRFVDCHVSPTCSPTRSALMTGRHEFRNGVTHTIYERERLTLKATTVAQVLKGAGYATGIFGKWHLGDEAEYQPNRRGFDEVFIHGAGGIGQTYAGSCGDAPGNTYFDPAILHNGTFEKTKGYCTDVFFAQALRWIEATKGRQPFFAYITPNAPHAPLHCPPEWVAPYQGKVPAATASFFGMIANIDANVGTLLDKLAAWGLERDTLVVFMNDNGGTAGVKLFNAGMREGKGTPYVGGTRAVSLWRWPGTLAAGVDVDRLTAHLDFFPTVAELAGASCPPGQVEGRSLVPLLLDRAAPWADRTLVTHVGRWAKGEAAGAKFSHASIRNGRYQLVYSRGGAGLALYDVRADLAETTDVSGQHPDVVRELNGAYDRWWDEIQPCLVNENVIGPRVNPFKALYYQQFGGGPAN